MSKLTDLLQATRLEIERRMKAIEARGEGLPREWWDLREIDKGLQAKTMRALSLDKINGEWEPRFEHDGPEAA